MTATPAYKVLFTPVGWAVVYTREARDPYLQFGLGADDYRLAADSARELNSADGTDPYLNDDVDPLAWGE